MVLGKPNNKKLSQKPQQQNNKQTDSKTSDVRHIFVHDSRLTLRINSKLKEAFLRHCKAKGVSVCHILEGLIYGYLRGFHDKIDLDVKSPTINLTLVRDVKRVRRYAVEYDGEDDFESVRCVFCGREAVGVYRHKSTGQEVPLCSFHAEHLKLNYEFVRWVDSDE